MGPLRGFWLSGSAAILVAASSFAAPIRVGIFKSYGANRFWHTNIHTAGAAIVSILQNPDSANLGPDLVKPKDGFIATQYGKLSGASTTSDAEEAPFFDALDSLDVVVFPSIADMGNVIEASHPAKRPRLLQHIRTKGVVSIHATTDSYGTWPAWDSVHGARFRNHPSSDREATLHLDSTARLDPDGRFLNRGLPDTARFVEEWLSFTTNADAIRATGVKVTVNVDEDSYEGGLGGASAMGDHPLSWYRTFPEGGRFFYTAIGHRSATYLDNGGRPSTPYLRRQIYNAILWAAGVDSNGVVPVRGRAAGAVATFKDIARASFSGSALAVAVLGDGPHAVEVRSLDGRLVAARRGEGRVVHEFAGLRPGTVHAVRVVRSGERLARLVTTP